MWKNDNEWMISLYKSDRILEEYWYKSRIPTLPFNIEAIMLDASVLDSNTGYLSVVYQFSNYDLCSSERDNSKKQGL